jgi:hypothetical protein
LEPLRCFIRVVRIDRLLDEGRLKATLFQLPSGLTLGALKLPAGVALEDVLHDGSEQGGDQVYDGYQKGG